MVKIGIIGVGNMGSAHLRCIMEGKIQNLKATAISDINPLRLDFYKKEYPEISCFSDYLELIKSGEVDAILISTPHPSHMEIALAAFTHGLHVLTEKPADITAANAKIMTEAAISCGKRFAIMFNQRTNPLFLKARQIVRGGQLGQLKRTIWIITNWYRSQSYYDSAGWRATWAGEGGGVLLNQAPHNLDLWQWICGMPESITAFCETGKYHNIETEDDVTIFAKFPGGAVGTFITTTGEYPGTNRLEISGDLGKIVIEDGALKHWRLKMSERETCFSSREGFPQIEAEYEEYHQQANETAHAGILENFTNSILYDEKLISPGSDGVFELMISNAAYLSQWQKNKEILLPFDEELFGRELKKRIDGSSFLKNDIKNPEISEYTERWRVRW